jgi:hypothetical protein
VGCPPNEGTFTPAPELRFTNLSLSQSRAVAGDEITITWDFENADLLKAQSIQGFSLVLQGLVPTEPVPLDNNVRSFTFQFTGPITVVLTAEDEDTIDDETTNADNVAFDILLDERSFFVLDFRPVNTADEVPGAPPADSPNYPRLGANDFRTHEIRFSQFVGFFDRPSVANGVIDALTPFLATDSAFRALSLSVNESANFNMAQGSGYQLFSVPALGAANAYVFGGAISYEGESIPIKTDDDPEFAGKRGGVIIFEPVFMALSLLVGFQNATVDIVDIQIGNLAQGFVATLNTGTLNNGGDLLRGIQGTANISFTNNGNNIGTISGLIKGAHVGFGVTTVGGDIFDAIINIVNAEWSMPFLFDTDFGGRLAFAR